MLYKFDKTKLIIDKFVLSESISCFFRDKMQTTNGYNRLFHNVRGANTMKGWHCYLGRVMQKKCDVSYMPFFVSGLEIWIIKILVSAPLLMWVKYKNVKDPMVRSF